MCIYNTAILYTLFVIALVICKILETEIVTKKKKKSTKRLLVLVILHLLLIFIHAGDSFERLNSVYSVSTVVQGQKDTKRVTPAQCLQDRERQTQTLLQRSEMPVYSELVHTLRLPAPAWPSRRTGRPNNCALSGHHTHSSQTRTRKTRSNPDKCSCKQWLAWLVVIQQFCFHPGFAIFFGLSVYMHYCFMCLQPAVRIS